jgi:autophagy-related protein 16
MQELALKCRQKYFIIQIVQDELQALQLELLTSDERQKQLAAENSALVQRWLARVNETVS